MYKLTLENQRICGILTVAGIIHIFHSKRNAEWLFMPFTIVKCRMFLPFITIRNEFC